MCENITDALDLWLHSPHQSIIKTVVIKKPAPGTSHEAVTFRKESVGVLICKQEALFEKVYDWALNTHERDPLLVDMQQGILAKESQDKLQIKKGYVCYPLPLEYSMKCSPRVEQMYLLATSDLSADKALSTIEDKNEIFNARLKGLIQRLTSGETVLVKNLSDLQGLVEAMASGESQKAKVAAGNLLRYIQNKAHDKNLEILPVTRLELELVLENIVDIIENQFLPVIDSEPQSLERLYPVRLIEACLFQDQQEVKGGFSLVSTLKSARDQSKALGLLQSDLHHVIEAERKLSDIPFVRVSRAFLKEELAELWLQTLMHLDSMPKNQVSRVRDMFVNLSKLDSLVDYANVSVAQFMKDYMDEKGILPQDNVYSLFEKLTEDAQASEECFEKCWRTHGELQRLLGIDWSNPEQVQKQKSYLIEAFIGMGFIDSQSSEVVMFNQMYKEAAQLSRFLLLNTALEAVRVYDTVLKKCKSSQNYKTKRQQAGDFKELLDGYRKIMQEIAKVTKDQKIFEEFGTKIGKYGRLTIENYLSRIDRGYTLDDRKSPGFENIDPNQQTEETNSGLMIGTRDFNVSAAVVGNKVDYDRSLIWPESLEDYFTLFHQNMETMICALKQKNGFSEQMLPENLRTFCQTLMNNISRRANVNISGIGVVDAITRVNLDVPLNQHAAKVTVEYDRSKTPPLITTHVDMMGCSEHCRWELTAAAASLIGSDIDKIKVSKPKIFFDAPFSVHFEVETKQLSQDESLALVSFLGDLCKFSFHSTDGGNVGIDYLNSLKKLRKAFSGNDEVNPSRRDMENGGWYMALSLFRTPDEISSLTSFLEGLVVSKRNMLLGLVHLNGMALAYADDNLKKDLEIVEDAVRQNPLAYEYVHESLRNDPTILSIISS